MAPDRGRHRRFPSLEDATQSAKMRIERALLEKFRQCDLHRDRRREGRQDFQALDLLCMAAGRHPAHAVAGREARRKAR